MTPKSISFTPEEVNLLLQMCDKVPVTGPMTARLLVSVADKLSASITVDASELSAISPGK